MKIVVNKCFGGFSVSEKVKEALGLCSVYDEVERDDPKLIHLVETLGDDANGRSARLRIVEIPDEATDWEIDEYDGAEKIIYVLDGLIWHA